MLDESVVTNLTQKRAVFPAFSSREVTLSQTRKIGIHFIIYRPKRLRPKRPDRIDRTETARPNRPDRKTAYPKHAVIEIYFNSQVL